MKTDGSKYPGLFQYLLHIADDRLILGHRLSEWCGHGPILEEDIALANIALDCLGHAQWLFETASSLDPEKRGVDRLIFFREAIDFRNSLLVEQPNGDFAQTIARQFITDAFAVELFGKLATSRHDGVAAVAVKALKEIEYHIKHSTLWVIRLGDGTAESHQRLETAFRRLWEFVDELFTDGPDDAALISEGIVPSRLTLRSAFAARCDSVFKAATLALPQTKIASIGGRRGFHSEHLGHLLAEMQILARSHPSASW